MTTTADSISRSIIIESFRLPGGEHLDDVRLRPVSGQRYSTSLLVEGNKSLTRDYPVGTRFKVVASLRAREGAGQYLYSSWQWDVTVL